MPIQMTMTTLEEFKQQYPARVIAKFDCEHEAYSYTSARITVERNYKPAEIDGVDYALDRGWEITMQTPQYLAASDAERLGRALIEAAEWIRANP